MEQSTSSNSQQHIIDITSGTRGSIASSSGSHDDGSSSPDTLRQESGPSSSMQAHMSQSSFSSSSNATSRNASLLRRGDSSGRRRHRSPLNSGWWISIELVITVSQIIASVVILSLSRHENPQTPLFAWVVGYASGCVATLPLLYWRYLHRNQQASTEQESTHGHQGSQGNLASEATSYSAISIPRAADEENRRTTTTRSYFARIIGTGSLSSRLSTLVDHFKMALDCFFAVWFVVGNVWIFGGHTSASDAPNLYRLCIVFLTFSCIGYAMPFILCATICCCLPCIISIMGFREDLNLTRGATLESIGALPTYKFKLKRNRNREETEINSEGGAEGGIVAAGTNKERVISAEDAVCCICLAKYADNDELRELPCSHFFHKECVDKWLKINASCPLCKAEVGESIASLSSMSSSWHQSERRVGNGSTAGAAYGSTIF